MDELVSMNDTTGPWSCFGFVSPLSSSADIFHPRSPGLKGRVDVYRGATHITACVCTFVSVCIWSNGSDDLFFFVLFFFSDLYMSVVLFIGFIESMFFFFFVNHLLGRGWLGLIYQM